MRTLLCFLALLASASAGFAQTTFSIEVASIGVPAGCNPSLALETDGAPSIAYWDSGTILARKSNGFWSFESVAPNGFVLSTRSLAITSSGDPVLALNYNGLTHLARRMGGLWSFEPMQGLDPWTMALALDHNDGAHVVEVWSWGSGLYSGFIDYDREEVSRTIFIPSSPSLSLAVDSYGAPHIVHTPTQGAAMMYWTKVGSSWVSETLPVGTWAVVAVDLSDGLHMAYYDQGADALVYGTRSAGGWEFAEIDWLGDVGMAPSLAIDTLGRPHVSYYDVTHQDLRYAVLESGTWRAQTVASIGNVGALSSIAISGGQAPVIAYCDATRFYLMLATGEPPTPTRSATLGSVKALYHKR